LQNHAAATLACDFFVAVTVTFRTLYVFVVIEHGTRRLAHPNVTSHPSAHWTLQQLREVLGEVLGESSDHKFLIHDRDAIYARHLDSSIRALGLEVLRSPIASPKANRPGGTSGQSTPHTQQWASTPSAASGTSPRRTSTAAPRGAVGAHPDRRHSASRHGQTGPQLGKSKLNARTMDAIDTGLRAFRCDGCLIAGLYNRGRPHSALGPGVPDPALESVQVPKSESRHRLPAGARVLAKSVLGGLHHEYSIAAPPATA
jgi:hypothetical protein